MGFSVEKRLCQRCSASFAKQNPRRGPMSLRGLTNPANMRGHSPGSSSVSSPPAGALYRFIHRPPLAHVPTARANVASWVHESREGTWANSGILPLGRLLLQWSWTFPLVLPSQPFRQEALKPFASVSVESNEVRVMGLFSLRVGRSGMDGWEASPHRIR